MEKEFFLDKKRELRRKIFDLKHQISSLEKQYVSESEINNNFPIGTIAKVVNNKDRESFFLACIEKYEISESGNIKPVLLKVKKDGTPSKHHIDFLQFSEHLEKYEH